MWVSGFSIQALTSLAEDLIWEKVHWLQLTGLPQTTGYPAEPNEHFDVFWHPASLYFNVHVKVCACGRMIAQFWSYSWCSVLHILIESHSYAFVKFVVCQCLKTDLHMNKFEFETQMRHMICWEWNLKTTVHKEWISYCSNIKKEKKLTFWKIGLFACHGLWTN